MSTRFARRFSLSNEHYVGRGRGEERAVGAALAVVDAGTGLCLYPDTQLLFLTVCTRVYHRAPGRDEEVRGAGCGQLSSGGGRVGKALCSARARPRQVRLARRASRANPTLRNLTPSRQ